MSPIKMAIVGGGFGIDGHLPAFSALPDVQVLAVADSGSGRIRERLQGRVAYLPSWIDVFKLPIDAISVVVPPVSQKGIVIEALRRGKHVFCEKPFGMNLLDAEAMLAEADDASDCTTAVNFQFRFEPGIQELKKQSELGIIGEINAIDFSWLTAGRANPLSCWSWRNDQAAGGGVIGAFFSHVADLVWWLLQRKFQTVFGQTAILVKHRHDDSGSIREVTAEDMVIAQLQLDDGVTATCRISNCQIGGDGMRIEVRGSDGVLVYRHTPPFEPKDQQLMLSLAQERNMVIPIHWSEQGLAATDTRLWALHIAASHFTRKIQGYEDTCAPDFIDGLRVHRVMDALRQSAYTGLSVSI